MLHIVTSNLPGCCMALQVPDLRMGADIGWASQDFRMGTPRLQLPLCIFELLLAA